jgi:hypothetical protein
MRFRSWLGLAVLAALVLPAPALATHSAIGRISVGETTGFAQPHASFAAATGDGSRVLFAVAPTPDQANGAGVLFERSGAVTTLISADESGQPHEVRFTAMSTDGTRVFFQSAERLTSADTDDLMDTYERSGGVTRLVTTGPTDQQTESYAAALRISDDGTSAFFESSSALVAADTDTAVDIYRRSGGVTTLVSTRPDGSNGGTQSSASLAGISSDGVRVFFLTDEALVASDTDGAIDLYQRSGGTTTMVSDWDSPFAFSVQAVSSDGSKVIIATRTQLAPGDVDSAQDVYELSGGQRTLLSTGSVGGSEAALVSYSGATRDATVVWFTTFDKLSADDTDTGSDLYRRQGGTTTLISTGPGAGPVGQSVKYLGQAGNGLRTYFHSFEQLLPEDTDTSLDIYERTNGVTTLISTGPDYAGANIRADLAAVSGDGSRVFFETTEALVAGTSPDGFKYVYERTGGVTYLVASDADQPFPTGSPFGGITLDGTTVYYNQFEIPGEGLDPLRVVFEIRVSAYVRVRGATPMRYSLVPAYQQCAVPNRTHGAPLALPSCAPPVLLSTAAQVGGRDGIQPSRSVGYIRFRVLTGAPTPPDDTDVRIQMSLTNVLANPSLLDYEGALRVRAEVRLTDGDGGIAQTAQDFPFYFDAPCTALVDPLQGSTCATVTTLDAVLPGAAPEGARSIWALSHTRVLDGGVDGDPDTEPNGLLAVHGVFFP